MDHDSFESAAPRRLPRYICQNRAGRRRLKGLRRPGWRLGDLLSSGPAPVSCFWPAANRSTSFLQGRPQRQCAPRTHLPCTSRSTGRWPQRPYAAADRHGHPGCRVTHTRRSHENSSSPCPAAASTRRLARRIPPNPPVVDGGSNDRRNGCGARRLLGRCSHNKLTSGTCSLSAKLSANQPVQWSGACTAWTTSVDRLTRIPRLVVRRESLELCILLLISGVGGSDLDIPARCAFVAHTILDHLF